MYIPPNRASPQAISLGLAKELPTDVSLLEDAAKEIENAIGHLSKTHLNAVEAVSTGPRPLKGVHV